MRPFSYEVIWRRPDSSPNNLGRAKTLLDAANLARRYDFIPHHFSFLAHYINGEKHFVNQRHYANPGFVSHEFARKRVLDYEAISFLTNNQIEDSFSVASRFGTGDPLRLQIQDYMSSAIWTWKTDLEIQMVFGEDIPNYKFALPNVICDICGATYNEHLYCLNYEDYDGNPFLRVICDGSLVKVG